MHSQSVLHTTSRRLIHSTYPWIVFLLGASFFFYKYFVQVSPSVMTADLMRDFHINGTGLGNLSACYFYSYLIMQIPVGILLDRYSPRYLTAFAILTCGISTLIFSQANTLGLASFSRALIGLGAAFSAVSCFKLVSLWFPAHRFALVSGMCMTAAMLGAVFGQYPLSLLVQHFDWRTALKMIGSLGIILSVVYFLIVKDKQTMTSITSSNHQSNALHQFGSILKNKQAWLLSLYSGLAFAPVSVFGGLWGVPFLQEAHQLTASQASFSTSCIFVGFALGAPLLGWLSDVIKRRKPIMFFGPLLALFTIVIVIYSPIKSVPIIGLLLFAFGFGASGFFTSFAMIREVFPLALAASVLGFMNTFDSVFEALTEPLIGSFLDCTWDGMILNGVHHFSVNGYKIALLSLPIFLLSALVVLFCIKETRCEIVKE